MIWHWPQYIYAGLVALSVFMHAVKAGERKTDRYGEPLDFISIAVCVWILHCGGFW